MKKYILILFALIFAACSSKTPQITYYNLPVTESGGDMASGGGYILVPPVEVADYLAGTGIVYQVNTVEYKTARSNRWAEPLSTQLQRSLAEMMRNSLPGTMVLTESMYTPPIATVYVNVNGFHGRHGGQAVVSGEWLITGKGGIITAKTFTYAIQQDGDGYSALVQALYKGWAAEAEVISAAVRALPD